jgi:hypothetical protein
MLENTLLFTDLMYKYNTDPYRVLRNSRHTSCLTDRSIRLIADLGVVKSTIPMEDYATHRFFSVSIELDAAHIDKGLAGFSYEYTAIFGIDIWSKMLALSNFMCNIKENSLIGVSEGSTV